MLKAALSDLEARARLVSGFLDMDGRTIGESLCTFAMPEAAMEWLVAPAAGLSHRIPTEVASARKGRRDVIALLKRIDAETT